MGNLFDDIPTYIYSTLISYKYFKTYTKSHSNNELLPVFRNNCNKSRIPLWEIEPYNFCYDFNIGTTFFNPVVILLLLTTTTVKSSCIISNWSIQF